jgi:hypothetical protein
MVIVHPKYTPKIGNGAESENLCYSDISSAFLLLKVNTYRWAMAPLLGVPEPR